jgi:hypothetical protein
MPRDVLDGELDRIAALGVRINRGHRVEDLDAERREGGFDAAFVPDVPVAPSALALGLAAIHCQVEKMGRAGDARVVIANRLLALPGKVPIVEIQPASHIGKPRGGDHERQGPRDELPDVPAGAMTGRAERAQPAR